MEFLLEIIELKTEGVNDLGYFVFEWVSVTGLGESDFVVGF
jgi:hypothetical protein